MKRIFFLAFALVGCRTGLPRASLHGRIVLTGESSAGIVVSAGGPVAATTTTDENGEYFFPALELGAYTVTATVRSTVESHREVVVDAGGPVEVPDLRFTPAGELSGRATRGGAPSGNAGILLTVQGSSAAAVTDDSGGYHLSGVPVGRYDLGAQLAGYRGGGVSGQTVRWGETTSVPQIDLVIGAGHASLRGTALLYQLPDHSGTRVVVSGTGLETVTDADGNWAIEGVPEGTYQLRFDNGFYRETVAAVEALPGSNGFVIDDSLYPLDRSPLTLFPARRLDGTRGASTALISPDGTRILYGDGRDGTLRSALLDGSPPIILAHPWYGNFSYGYSDAALSPDGAFVAFRSNDLELVPSSGGASTHIAYAAGSLLFAPSGGLLGYFGTDSVKGTTALFVTPYPGVAPRMLVSDSKMSTAVWSGDGSHLVYRTNIDDYWRLGTVRIVSAAGGPATDLASGAFDPVVRPDRRYALVLANVNTWDGSATLLSIDLANGNTVQLGAPVSSYDGYAFAGDRVVFRQSQTLYSIPITGGTPTTLAATGMNFKVSTDGNRVLYSTDCTNYSSPCTAWTVPSAGGTPQMVATGVFDYGFSSDGNRVWFSTDRDNQGVGALWITAVGGTPVELEPRAYPWVTQFVPNGALYMHDVTNDSHGTLMLWNGAATTLGHDVESYGWQVAPDARHLAFIVKPVGGVRSLWLSGLDGSAGLAMLDNVADSPTFTKLGALVVRRTGSLPPYRFQDGFYVVQP